MLGIFTVKKGGSKLHSCYGYGPIFEIIPVSIFWLFSVRNFPPYLLDEPALGMSRTYSEEESWQIWKRMHQH